ncbi:transcription factor HES-3 [Amblyraja radiata]|uniref:transcription factor HES-3 n=1 Tax=Amblyraja radiata TaxID=386614 RepID=UPI0014040F28|nr:transcription factor HES-3 [Amblyraja radiata]
MKNTNKPAGRFLIPVATQTCGHRKISKPLMEKKRRARINECLEQLKSLLEDHYSNNIRKRKLEKADILELTVKHLRDLQSSRQGAVRMSRDGAAQYQAGFRSCLNAVSQYLLRSKGTEEHLRLGVLNHLVTAFPVFSGSGSGFGAVDGGSRNEGRLLVNPAAQPQGELCGPAAKATAASALRHSIQQQVADIAATENSSPETPAQEQDAAPVAAQTKPPANRVASFDLEPPWRPW